MSQILTYARIRLKEWGQWSRYEVQGYPIMSAFWRIVVGRGGTEPEPPIEVTQVEGIVRRAPTAQKEILIFRYCRRYSIRECAAWTSSSKSTASRLLEQAEWYVHTELDCVGQKEYTVSNCGEFRTGTAN
jgi:hypothetical protein